MTQDIPSLKQQASELRKNGKLEEALPIFDLLWHQHRSQCNEWDGWGYAFCLRKLHQPEAAAAICREAMVQWPDFERVRDVLAWSLYDQIMKPGPASNSPKDEAHFFETAAEITRITRPGQYSAFARTLFKVVDHLKDRAIYPAEQILEWLDCVDPNELSLEAGTGETEDGKPRTFPSDQEKWYAERSHALFELGQFQACIEVATQALQRFKVFHLDYDVWFKWRRAQAQANLGQLEVALEEFKGLLSRKRDWFIQHRIAQCLFDLDRPTEAVPYALEAAIAPGDVEYKWKLFLLMGQLFLAEQKGSDATLHVHLAVRLCQEHEWKIAPELAELANKLKLDMNDTTPSRELHNQLRQSWRDMQRSLRPLMPGIVKNLVPGGNAGFIRGDDGSEYYFRLQAFRGKRDRVQPGLKVRFQAEQNLVPGKKDNAIYVELAE